MRVPIFKGKSYPLRKGMMVSYKKPIEIRKNGKCFNGGYTFVTATIINARNDQNQHIFKIRDSKGKQQFIKASQLYQTVEIISLDTYTYWDDLKENFAVKLKKGGGGYRTISWEMADVPELCSERCVQQCCTPTGEVFFKINHRLERRKKTRG